MKHFPDELGLNNSEEVSHIEKEKKETFLPVSVSSWALERWKHLSLLPAAAVRTLDTAPLAQGGETAHGGVWNVRDPKNLLGCEWLERGWCGVWYAGGGGTRFNVTFNILLWQHNRKVDFKKFQTSRQCYIPLWTSCQCQFLFHYWTESWISSSSFLNLIEKGFGLNSRCMSSTRDVMGIAEVPELSTLPHHWR